MVLIDAARVSTLKPLTGDLGDWQQALLAKGVTAKQVELLGYRTSRVINGVKAAYITDLNGSAVSTFLGEIRKDKDDEQGVSLRTAHFYLRAMKQFVSWMVKDGRASSSPLAHLSIANPESDVRHARRTISDAEFARLLNAASSGPTRYRMDGPSRRLLYLVAATTGLRAGELGTLTRADLDLNDKNPALTVQAAYSKARCKDSLPLRADIAAELRAFTNHMLADAQVFANMPDSGATAKMLRFDLTRAKSTTLTLAGVTSTSTPCATFSSRAWPRRASTRA